MTKVVNRLFLVALLGVVVLGGHFMFKGELNIDTQVNTTVSATTLEQNDYLPVRGISANTRTKATTRSTSALSVISSISHQGSASRGPVR